MNRTPAPSVRPVAPAINGWSADYLDAQYARWQADPASTPADLASFFQGFDLARAGAQSGHGAAPVNGEAAPRPAQGASPSKQAAASALVHSFRALGHLAAAIDPFGRERPMPPELAPGAHGLSDADLGVTIDPSEGSPVMAGGALPPAPLREIIRRLDETYCASIGAEFMHIGSGAERIWLAERMESCANRTPLSREDRVHVLEQITRADAFERFLHTRYPGEKRFSLEGAESLIPLLDRIVNEAPEFGVEELALGMAHRGRLNVLNNIVGKTYEQIFTEFEDNWEDDFVDGGGDVKYHRGYSGERVTTRGRTIWLAMASNPSHLESVNAVVEGRARAKQRLRGDKERRRVMPLLIHGDGAVIAQGVVAECLNFSQLEGYTTGGTIHVVINNLIAFTTGEEDARTSRYCTDLAKMIDAPVLHVNGEDPEACVHAAQIALEYRQTFRKDVFIDVWCYRKWGHNESDEPSFTQPVMYSLIREKTPVLQTYTQRLVGEGVVTEADAQRIRQTLDEAFNRAQAATKQAPSDPTIDPGSRKWAGYGPEYSHAPIETGVAQDALREVAGAMGRAPEGFNLNKKLVGLLKARAASCDNLDADIDYATAESLAIGSLLVEGTPVRLTGQDARRGTFSHRQAVLRDAATGEPYTPLNNIREVGEPGTDHPLGEKGRDGKARQARFCVYDSPLSEYAIVGFDYGYASVDPSQLVMWEAQFGDFANTAQVMYDQYLAPAELKWQRWNGLVLLLPHGYEGAGPEHSSCRLERFLQICGDDNMQVVNPSTASQVFHLLRRQVRRKFRKPLIVATPKSMLRAPTSKVRDLVSGRFMEMIDDPAFVGAGAGAGSRPAKAGVSRVVLCSGKVYFELADRRAALGRTDIAIVRVEQMYPLHESMLREILASYPKSAEVVWCQEEPENMGAYRHMEAALRETFGVAKVRYIGRPRSATPAVGSKHVHKEQQEAILTEAIGPAPTNKTPATAAKEVAVAQAAKVD